MPNWRGCTDHERPKGVICDRGGFRGSSSTDTLSPGYSLDAESWRHKEAQQRSRSKRNLRTTTPDGVRMRPAVGDRLSAGRP